VRQVARVMEVSHSNLIEQREKAGKRNSARPSKTDDAWSIPVIREVTDKRPTYGYRRVTQLLNLNLERMRKPVVNHKRIYRIMKSAGLLLRRHTGKFTRTHD
jgi:putative transposase